MSPTPLTPTCQTPGAQFHTRISPREVACTVTLPHPLTLTEKQASELDTNMHNAVELVLARYFPQTDRHTAGPDALRLAQARQYLAPRPSARAWDDLTDNEREACLQEARLWLRAADNAGLTARHARGPAPTASTRWAVWASISPCSELIALEEYPAPQTRQQVLADLDPDLGNSDAWVLEPVDAERCEQLKRRPHSPAHADRDDPEIDDHHLGDHPDRSLT
jgi:hypothetical protein